MEGIKRYIGQAIGYLLFILFIGYFSQAPVYTHLESDEALVKLTFTHAGKRLVPCGEQTAGELAKLPPQLRFKQKCPRERSPLRVEFEVDGQKIYADEIQPRGLSKDLPAPVYQRIVLPAGRHLLRVRMHDDVHTEGFNYTAEKNVELRPLQTLIVDFDNTRHTFIFQ